MAAARSAGIGNSALLRRFAREIGVNWPRANKTSPTEIERVFVRVRNFANSLPSVM